MSARHASLAFQRAVSGTGSCSTPVTETTIGLPPPDGASIRTGAIGDCGSASAAARTTKSCASAITINVWPSEEADLVEQVESQDFELDAEVLDDELHLAVEAGRSGEMEVAEQILGFESELELSLRPFDLGADDVADLDEHRLRRDRHVQLTRLVPLRTGA